MARNWLTKLLDEAAPGWRKDTKCPACKKKIHPLEISKHLREVHGIVKREETGQ